MVCTSSCERRRRMSTPTSDETTTTMMITSASTTSYSTGRGGRVVPRLGRRLCGHGKGFAQMARWLAPGQRSLLADAQFLFFDPVDPISSFGEFRHDIAREELHGSADV